MVLELLKKSCLVTQAEIKRGLHNVQLLGRFQIFSTQPFIILDVAHNVQAARILRHSIEQLGVGRLHVIVGMLKDKEVLEVLSVLAPIANSWRIIDLDTPRAMPAEEIEALLINNIPLADGMRRKTQCFSNIEQAYQNFNADKLMLNAIDKLLIFGSFFTVTDALHSLQSSDSKTAHE